ncbi:hypothetical protein KJ877_08890 [bacterium]|nr:hypothetical protein [bacterium]MBU1990813.1 hypothetical protein [bacterium]
MTYLDIETKIKTINNWFNNLRENVINEEVLILCIKGRIDDRYKKKLEQNIKDILLKNEDKEYDFNIFSIQYWLKEKRNSLKNQNTILLANNHNVLLSQIRQIQSKTLLFSFPSEYYENIEMLLANTQNAKIDTSKEEFYSFYTEIKDPQEVINQSQSTLRQFLDNTICIKDASSVTNFLKNTNLLTYADDLIDATAKAYKKLSTNNSLQEEYIFRDIVILKEMNILTSRLSIAIYRKANLDTNISITEVGRYFSSKYNKSKVIDLKKISKNSSIDYDGLSKTKVKAYNLDIKAKSEKEFRKEIEIEIKEHIAKKLLYFTDIDIDTIQRIVELPKSTLKGYR